MNTITGFCDRAILLERGQVLLDAKPATVSTFYHRLLFGEGSELAFAPRNAPPPIGGKAGADPTTTAPEVLNTDILAEGIDHLNDAESAPDLSEYRFGTNAAEIYDWHSGFARPPLDFARIWAALSVLYAYHSVAAGR